uniref:Myc n=1 Tax=Drosophila pseudoobscura pseudoobscura TaxID=46245 RepID=A0AA97IPS0_DROPS|nr:TPA: Myc [Drosophila pseudoobscura pseudoobscura]DBA35688.1 TPA: Myc [Drosophila pseudoobscura pseudoobscura]
MALPFFDFPEGCLSQIHMDEELFTGPFNIDDMFGGDAPSIQSDLAKIESREGLDYFDDMEDMKPEIRNGDCMWSASSSCHSNGSAGYNNSAASSYSDGIAIPLSIVTGGANPYQCQQEEQQQHQQQQQQQKRQKQNSGTKPGAEDLPVIIKQEPLDDYLPSMEKRARLCVSGKTQTQSESTAYIAADQLIPPGGSLLRKRNVILQGNQRCKMGPTVAETKPAPQYRRPDTPPHSIPDESAPETAPMFRHNVDLRACVMGSNNICLTSDGDVNCINQISRELQNANKTLFSLFPVPEINDVMDVLSQESQQQSQQSLQSLQSLSIQQALEVAANATTVKVSPPNSSSDYDSDDETYREIHKSTMLMRHISDHSYTRCNELDDRHAPETPSDSDEEIDVVSFPDKKQLQNTVGDLDLLEKVAHQISHGINQKKPRYGTYMPYTPASSSPVKSVANSRYPSPSSTPYQASSQSYSPLTVDSSNASSSSSSSSSSGYGCGGATKGHKRYYLKFSSNGTATAGSSAGTNGMSVHKMASNGSSSNTSNTSNSSSSNNSNSSSRIISKKCRSKKSSPSSCSSSELGSPVSSTEADASNNWMNETNSTMNRIPKHNSVANMAPLARSSQRFSVDEADTIEKRNQHNDMERQRRIGLKNLFEALKKQIPTIRDKERAPKVNILREAAKLCEQLTHEEHDLAMEYQRLREKNRKRQELLVRLRAASTVHTVTDESRKWVGQRPK